MKNKPKPTSRPKKQLKLALKKTPAVKAALLGKKKKPAEKTGKNKIRTLDNANLHKMEKELRETKERLHLLTEAAEEGIAIHDKGIIIDANDALARIFGYELSEMIGIKAERFTTRESWKVIWEHMAAGYDKPYEAVGVRKDGSTFICSLIGKLYKYKGRTLRVSAFRDITELKKMEEKYRNILENIQEGYFEVDIAGNYTFLNDSMCLIHGYPKKELMSMNNRQYTEKDVAKKVFKAFNEVYKTGKPLKHIDWQIIRKDGVKRHIEASVSLRKDSLGKPIGFRGIIRDITESKQAEAQKEAALEAVRERDLRFRKLSLHIPGMIYQFMRRADGTYCVPFSSEAVKDIFGCSPQDVREDFSPIAKVIFPEDLDKLIASIEYSAQHLTTWRHEYRLQIPGQSIKWLFGHSTPEKLADGSIIWHGFNTDITERKKAEKDLQNSEELFRNLFNYHSAVKLIIDPATGNIVDANEAAVNYYGWPHEQLTRMKIQDINTLSHEEVKAAIKKVQTQKSTHFEFQHRRADGSVRDVEVFGSNIKAQGKDILHTIVHDITERKRAEEEIKSAKVFLDMVINLSPFAMWISDKEGTITRVNLSLCNVINLTENEIVGKYNVLKDLNLEIQGVMPMVRSVFEKHEPARFIIPWKAADAGGVDFKGARDMHIDVSMFPILNAQGELINVVCQWVDITERKKSEEALEKYREHLEDLVRERTIKLEASNKELEAFSYSASHDLRAPLRSIDGFSQALLEDCENKLDIQGKDYLIRIRAATRRMAELIDDLLQLSRITRTEMNIEKVNLTRIARSVIDELQKSQPQRHVEISIADGLEDTADSKLIRIVLENLLGNAWKFTEKQTKAVIEFGFTEKGKKKIFFIRDNGVGFDMAYADKLFAPFQRLHTEEEFPGTGIGLATVRRIIHRHGGKVWTEGQTGKGATFYFSLNEK
jgi:PAS domain S-box-containing protein